MKRVVGVRHPFRKDRTIKKFILLPASIAGIGLSALFAGGAFASQGSGGSADNRNDTFVVICHYDRNQQGPNAGPHTITVNTNALDHHLLNHVKAEGFVGDDHVDACPEATPVSTFEATATASATAVPTLEPTATAEPTLEPTATAEPTLVPTATAEPTLEPTATTEPTLEPTAEPTATETAVPD